MIDLLTQQQQWGWYYALQNHNAGITAANVRQQEANAILPPGTDPVPPAPLLTIEQYFRFRVEQIGNQSYEDLIRYKEQIALSMFRALSEEQQAALVAQFQIPDVLQ
jgi:hypothetical protein